MSSLPVIFFLRLLAPEKFVSCATKILKIVSDEAYPVETVADVSVIAAADMAKVRPETLKSLIDLDTTRCVLVVIFVRLLGERCRCLIKGEMTEVIL